MTEDESPPPLITFEAPATGLYKVVSEEVTQYVWIVKGKTEITIVRSREQDVKL